VDAQTNRVLRRTRISTTPAVLPTTTGPVLAADRYGAWIVGVDARGRPLLTRVLPDGGRPHTYSLGGRPLAVATGLHAVWVLERGTRLYRLRRLDPATGNWANAARFPLSSGVDTLAVGFGDLWLISSTTAMLYRVDPRSGSKRHADLGQTAGRPVAMTGNIWVNLSDNGGYTTLRDPRNLSEVRNYTGTIGPLGTIGADEVGAFHSVWSYDVVSGEVDRWHPPNEAAHTPVTHAPLYGGSCMTSMAAAGGAIWVTLAPAAFPSNGNSTCDLF
jgi:hypothetical protein